MKLKLGISTCPNDTYIFAAMIKGLVKHDFDLDLYMDDVQVLNGLAIKGEADIVKVSYGVVPVVKDKYKILRTGGALGFGCGPLVVSSEDVPVESLRGKKIAIPGVNTSAFRFFKMFFGDDFEFVELRFDMIMPAIASKKVAAGVIIHEGRFIYEQQGLKKLCDLGELYEKKFNSPIPLGAILIRNELLDQADKITSVIRASIEYADNYYENIADFVKFHAQEMDDSVIKNHIQLYVNKYSKDVTPAIEGLCSFLGADKSVFV
ncbi:1,4-dihydroxy-6-naphthoate synthase [Seleniivibrio sp.]|uniref:1,4-dihydroxy-6-naphthoate synthase n=1 Tax=Seleniivibrio sp. TaxID=2898801 RepID=UPI0025D106B4|nr:1,4-dihydroxy-6-naphthoate synthase [Seleniivibrio sp.]MCD8553285.1 1,4-dihydroxy-6-naphthoate synthase [Seleniivibrio sp.]